MPPLATPTTLVFGGDVNLGRRQHRISAKNGYEDALGQLDDLRTADLVLVNLECAVSTLGEAGTDKGERGPYFYRARPEMLNVLRHVGVSAVSLANNHSGDYGPQALLDGLEWLQRFGISASGAGKNRDAAWVPTLLRHRDLTIAVFSIDFTQRQFAATADAPGTAYLDPENPGDWLAELTERITNARMIGHVVLACVHWGVNWATEPSATKRKLGHTLIDAGFDAVLGSSAHVLQGIEIHKGRPILHDAGDLLFDSKGKPPQGGLFRLFIQSNGVAQIDFIPTHVGFGVTRKLSGSEAESACENFAEQCARLGTKMETGPDKGTRSVRLHAQIPLLRRSLEIAKMNATPLEVNVDSTVWEIDALPADIARLDLDFGPHRLLGLKVQPHLVSGREMIWVESFWHFDPTDGIDWRIDITLSPQGQMQPRWGGGMDHDPCDWMVPVSRSKPNRIYRDVVGLRPPATKDLVPCTLIVHVGLVNSGGAVVGPVSLPQHRVALNMPTAVVQPTHATATDWKKTSGELTLAADQLHATLLALRTSDPLRLAEWVAHMRRRSPDRYQVVTASLSTLLSQWATPNELEKTALQLACQCFDADAPGSSEKIAPLFTCLSLERISALFRTQFTENVRCFLTLLDAYLDKKLSIKMGPRAQFKLAALAYIHAPDAQFARLISRLNESYSEASNSPPPSPQKSLSRVTIAHRRASGSFSPPVIGIKKRLRIALCVSGQMRAYRAAWPTWKHFGFFEHDVDIFVHTWRSIGWKFPNPQTGNGTERAFGHIPFRHAYVRCGTLYGTKAMWEAYPNFMQVLARDCGEVTEMDLRATYGENATVVVEDDPGTSFDPDPKNQRKMFHKIHAAHSLARAAGENHDLIVRIRPDRTARPPTAAIDLAHMALTSQEDFCVFGEAARVSNAMYVDDQFALGAPEVMDCYARTEALQQQASRENWYGFSPDLVPHLSLAHALFFQGVRVKPLQGARLGAIAGDQPMSRETIHAFLMRDIGGAPRSRMDSILLDALA